MIKSQDFLILIKLIGLQKEQLRRTHYPLLNQNYYDLNSTHTMPYDSILNELLSLRGLGNSLGISKTEIGASLRRSVDNKLLMFVDSQNNGLLSLNESQWQVNKRALFDLVKYAIPYYFAPKQLGLNYGLATGFSAPLLSKELTSAGTTPFVWPSEYGMSYGQAVEPIYKSVPFASSSDSFVYNCFALIDAYRMGKAREKEIAIGLLEQEIMGGR